LSLRDEVFISIFHVVNNAHFFVTLLRWSCFISLLEVHLLVKMPNSKEFRVFFFVII